MKGRDLILYILMNHLENEDVIDENGVMMGFMTIEDAAIKYNVGVATVRAWINEGVLEGIKLTDFILVPANAERPNP